MKVSYLELLEMIKDNRNPNTVKWNGKIYKWDLDNVNYAIYHKDSAEFLYDKQAMSVQATRKDIEIIEEDKPIEKLGYFQIVKNSDDENDRTLDYNNVSKTIDKIYFKINEIIDYLKAKEEREDKE